MTMNISKLSVCNRKNSIRCAAGVVVLFIGLLATAAFGDVVDDSLQSDTPQAVKTSARQAIQNGLQQDSVVKLTRAMLQHKFDQQQLQQAHALMIEAQNSGMPVQPIINKVFEGIAKGVDPSAIIRAMKTVQSRHSFAYQRAGKLAHNRSQTVTLGRTLSAALAAGFSKEDAVTITQMIQQRAQSMKADQGYDLALECYTTARDVSRLGVPSQAVSNMLAGALNKGFNHQDMHAMRSAFMDQARQSQPQNLARSYTAAIQEGKGFQQGKGGHAGAAGSHSAGPGSGGPVGSGPGGGGSSGGPGPGSGGSGGSGPGGGGSGPSSGGSGGSGLGGGGSSGGPGASK